MDAPSPPSEHPSPGHSTHPATTPAPSNQQPSAPKFSNGLHIRSRITVVCAECKRLKLKCDRRNPCGSCVKRDTVQRCQYTAAAAEKIDVQSLHNRLQIVESQIAQIFAGGLRVPTALSSSSSDTLPFPHNDHTMLATGASGSSVTVSLDDVAALWLEHLDLPHSYPVEPSSTLTPSGSRCSTPVKLEPASSDLAVHDEPAFPDMIPSFNIYYPNSTAQAVVTPSLVSLLPPAPTVRSRITAAIEETMKMRPCFNVKHFRSRAENMFNWAKEEDGRGAAGVASGSTNAKADLARSLFFPSAHAPTPVAASPRPTPTLSFFASVSAAYALGVLVCKENEAIGDMDAHKAGPSAKNPRLDDNRSASSQKAATWNKFSASGLYALSRQSMAAFEMAHTYDLDSVITYLLQIIYLLHDSRPRVAHYVYPLLGKVIHIAHMMGLSTDPDEFPGKYSLFEAEQRRRIWWDIYYYDVFISDAMGQAPSIQDGTYTTKMPADVDEEQFSPSSTSLPLPVPRRAGGDPTEVGFAYFIQKCRLAQLVKGVKKRSLRESNDPSETSVERAEQFESEVKNWLSELPRVFRFDAENNDTIQSASSKVPVSPNLQAQRCELAIIANQLILKIFLPYLKNCTEPSSDVPTRRVVSSIVDAGHAVLQAMRVLHTTWRQTRPAAFLFYSFGRTLFDTAVLMACAVIAYPSGASSSVAIGDVTSAVDIMKDTRQGSGRKPKEDGENDLSEAVKIITVLKNKAEAKRVGEDIIASPLLSAGSKRKHTDAPDTDGFQDGFELPYVGAGVKASHPSSSSSSSDQGPDAGSRGSSAAFKVKVKQRESSVAPDLSSPLDSFPPPEKDMGQIPVRGRPRTNSTVRHRHSSSKKHPPPTAAPAHPQPGTPAPDQPGFHPMPELTRPDSRSHAPPMGYGTPLYPSTSTYDAPQQQPQAHFAMPPPQAPPMHASPGYASLSGSGSSSQSSPAYSAGPGPVPSPHAYGAPPPQDAFYGMHTPTTPVYDSPMAALGGGAQEEPPYMAMALGDAHGRRLSFPHQQHQHQQQGAPMGQMQTLPSPQYGHGGMQGSWPPQPQPPPPDDGMGPRVHPEAQWREFGKYH